mmetsp:Transcript_98914/g.277915  ORF Transcript_98914/g.277915 Transcript_98914/m.277915 type:complete len:420 (+) Transcript_98914:37-1296(+)
MRAGYDATKEAAEQSARQAEVLAARREKHAAAAGDAAEGKFVVKAALAPGRTMKFCSICRVKGHGSRYCEVLLRRPDWQLIPSQKWFVDDAHNQYHCPNGNRLVDLCDEMHFSRMAMYLKGRQCLENKARLGLLVAGRNLMPDTFYIRDMQWVDGLHPIDADGDVLPWFVKEAEGNEGSFVECCEKASDCMTLARPGANFVVQQHVKDQLLYEGRKFHLRCHVLITCKQDGSTWRVYTYRDGYLNISPNQWSPDCLSRDTQVVIYRSQRIGSWQPWEDVYPKCQASAKQIIEQAVMQGQLEGRLGQEQFEIASLDYMVDTHGEVWLLEINMGPVLRDSFLDPDLNDDDLISAAFEIIVPQEDPPNLGRWDFVCELIGVAPLPAEPPAVSCIPEQVAAVSEELLEDKVVDDVLLFLDSFA